MLYAILSILTCQLIGEAAARASGLPVPGPVLGMGLMLALLWLWPKMQSLLRPVSQTILGHLLLMFVPAGVGATLQLGNLGKAAGPLVLAVVASTILAIAASALTFVTVARWTGHKASGEDAMTGNAAAAPLRDGKDA